MRSVVIAAAAAVMLALAGAEPTRSAPASGAAIGRAAAEAETVTKVRCWCARRNVRGVCVRVRCT
jgi:hypothetical protein